MLHSVQPMHATLHKNVGHVTCAIYGVNSNKNVYDVCHRSYVFVIQGPKGFASWQAHLVKYSPAIATSVRADNQINLDFRYPYTSMSINNERNNANHRLAFSF